MTAPIQFNRAEALHCARACLDAYNEPTGTHANAQWHVRLLEGTLTVALAGTNDIRDVLHNASLRRLTMASGSRVHSGFARHWGEASRLLAALPAGPVRRVLLTGHSLGATAAVFGHYFNGSTLRNLGPVTTYLFGCPRVGNRAFAADFDAGNWGPVWRVANNNDVVARSPRSWMGGWWHVGRFVYLDHRGDSHEEGALPDIQRDRWLGRLNDLGRLGPDGFRDHSILAYISALSGSENDPTPTKDNAS